MAEDPTIPTDVENNIDISIGSPKKASKKRKPTYQVVGDSKIPVALAQGKLWKSRLAQSKKAMSGISDTWEQAISYYDNDQLSHRSLTSGDHAGNSIGSQRLNNQVTETENVVFSNITTMVPALYARNPAAEFTSSNEAHKPLATMIERLVNVIGQRKASPGIKLEA